MYPTAGIGQHTKTSRLEMIPQCASSLSETNDNFNHCQRKFQSVLTNRGVCSAFNSVKVDSYFSGLKNANFCWPTNNFGNLQMRVTSMFSRKPTSQVIYLDPFSVLALARLQILTLFWTPTKVRLWAQSEAHSG